LRRDILAVLNQPHYRQASRRVAADMSGASGFAGLADIVDRLAANPRRSAPEDTVTPR
jgi:UDP:flavonoid glycosyltransferase YjiC (YdhE family)